MERTIYDTHINGPMGLEGSIFSEEFVESLRRWGVNIDKGIGAQEQIRKYLEYINTRLREASMMGILVAFDKPVDGKKVHSYTPNKSLINAVRDFSNLRAAISINPLKGSAVDELEELAGNYAIPLIKLNPPAMRFDPSDKRGSRLYRVLAKKQIPVLCHTGAQITTPESVGEYGDPKKLEFMLNCGVDVIAAHAGKSTGVEDCIKLSKRYPNMYIGLGGLYSSKTNAKVLRRVLDDISSERLIFGTDYPIRINTKAFRGCLYNSQLQEIINERNPFIQIFKALQFMGLPDSTFYNFNRFLEQNDR